ncbi:MAG: amino acid adenylation domain-containing protein, partial [Xenococcus sp. (in: cyanobacteria)]
MSKVIKATEIQVWLIDYLAQELEIEPEAIDITVPFERYGLDSSAAIVLTGDLEDWLGCELEPELLFDYQSIAELTEYIVDSGLLDSVSPSPPETEKVKVTPIFHQPNTTGVYPLSHGQQALWFLYKLAPESSAYNVAFTARIRSEVDVAALRGACQKLVDRHPLLRTTFGERDGKPVQQVHPHQEICFEEIDAGNWDQEQLKQKVIDFYKRPFDLEQGPVWRVSLFAISEKNYVLLITLHHIVCDGWSVWMLLDELRILYPAEQKGNIANLQPLEFSYTDYVNWQSEMLADREGQKLQNYWQEELAGELPILNLPTDRPRPAVQTYNGASHKFSLSQKLTHQLKELAHGEGVSLFMLLLAAYQVLLYRYTNQEDILVGVPMKCRNQTEFKKVFGYLVNPVVLRGDLSGNPNFKDFLHQIRHKVLGAVAHQDYPFPLLVDELEPERDSSRSPLVQTMFVLQKPQQSGDILDLFTEKSQESQVNWGGLQLEPFDIPQQEGQFDLSVEMMEAGNSILGVFHYNTDLFDATTIQRLEGHFQTLLQAIVAHPEAEVGKLPLLTEAELHQLLVEWNDTKVDYPQDKCIHELFEEQVAKTPDAVAVVFEEEQLTYQELNNRANQLAHYLQKLGVGPEVLVGICVERSLEMIVGLLGILKAGGAYVPIDPSYPPERLAYLLSDSEISILLTQNKLVSELPENEAQVICLERDWQVIINENEDNLINEIKPNNLAYVIYTSGSTGKPKGVMIEHKSLVNFTSTVKEEYGIISTDRILQFASISFDAAAEEIYPCLTCGATLVLRTDEMLSSTEIFLEKCRDSRLTVLDLPTAYWHQLTVDLVTKKLMLPKLLRLVIIGGEAALLERIAMWQTYIGDHLILLNTYGPTETTVVATKYQIPTTVSTETTLFQVPIGNPIANIETYILDHSEQLVPIGIPGELHIAGIGLARGYLNLPELTMEKFIPNPFSKKEEARLYKTGDLVRYLPEGNIEFLGRIDNQVKIRGFRIELGEIESVLTQHPDIREAVVLAREDQPGNKRLVSYIVLKETQDNLSQIEDFLKEKLPDYMIPSAFVCLESMPLTPNGKVDRHALPAPDTFQRRLTEDLILPRDSIELQLAQIWSNLMNLKPIGVKDNFFKLGGHSILAIQLVSKIQEQFGKTIPLSVLLQDGTIENIAN